MPMYHYLLFHSLAEIASATISFGTFLFAWNTRRFQNAYLLTVGAGALFVGFFETLHCLAFPGMPVFNPFDANLSPQLWMSARLFQAGASLAGLMLLSRSVRAPWLLGGFAVAFIALCSAVFFRLLPEVVVKPGGLTTFKVVGEWTLAAAYLGSVALLFRVRARFSPRVFRLLAAHGTTMAACEICFTLYTRPYDFSNFLGHVLLLAGGSLQYMAILRAGLIDPSETHFRDLVRAKDRLERAQSAGRIGTFEWDLTARGTVAITGIEGVYSDAPERLTGTFAAWRQCIHPDDLNRVDKLIAETIAGRAKYDTEYRILWPDGSVHWVAARGRLQRDGQGGPERLVGVNMDITERKQVEEALREADRRRNEFLGMLSHELRNPLMPIRNSLYILKRATPGGEQAGRAHAVIDRQVNHLARLVDDLLDVTRITRGKIRLQRARLDLADVVRRTVEDHRTVLEEHEVAIELPSEAIWVDGDPTRLAQVIGNLLNNAAKFTPARGRVAVSLSKTDESAVIEVTDTGIGMDRDMLEKMFEPFAQADRSLDRTRGGLGLGLALLKALVDIQGGTVRAYSDGPGRGARFTVALPLDKRGPADLPDLAARNPRETERNCPV